MFNFFKRNIQRKAKVARRTKETEINCSLNIDGKGVAEIDTGIGFLDHMLDLFVFHGLFDLRIKAKGDLEVDAHHTNEDIGIVLGQAFKKALGDMQGVCRFGCASAPMEDVLAEATLDISGRSHFVGIAASTDITDSEEKYTMKDANHFLESFTKHCGINLIIKVEFALSSNECDIHTVLEAVFKAFALALSTAIAINPRRKGVPSTKGIID